MSETVEIISSMRQESQLRRSHSRENSPKILTERGIEFEIKNQGVHLIVRGNGHVVDFWPGTGKFIMRERGSRKGRGVFNLLKYVQEGGQK